MVNTTKIAHDYQHHTIILSPKRASDHTGLYKEVLESTEKINQRLSLILNEVNELDKRTRVPSRGELTKPDEKVSLQSSQPSSTYPNLIQTKYFIRNQYESPIQRVSHL